MNLFELSFSNKGSIWYSIIRQYWVDQIYGLQKYTYMYMAFKLLQFISFLEHKLQLTNVANTMINIIILDNINNTSCIPKEE